MFTVEQSVTIGRPLGEVFELLREHTNDRRWRSDILEVKTSGVGTMPGSTFEQVIRFMGIKTYRFEVTRHEPGRLHEYRAVSGPGFRPTVTYLFRSAGPGTQVTARIAVQTLGLFRLIEPLMPGLVRKNWAGYLEALRQQLER